MLLLRRNKSGRRLQGGQRICRCGRCRGSGDGLCKVERDSKPIVVVRRHLFAGTELEHQMGPGRHHVLLLDTARCRQPFHYLMTLGDIVKLFAASTALHLEQGYEVRVAALLRHLHARETYANSRVRSRSRYEVPTHHFRRIDAREPGTGDGTRAFRSTIVVVIGPIAFGGCDAVATLRMEADYRMAQRRKTEVGQELGSFCCLRDAANEREVEGHTEKQIRLFNNNGRR